MSTRGICQYGKLNYYLGARAAQEGRPARYPTIDFCADPSAICATEWHGDSELEWITGLFRWIDSVQSYEKDGWNYIHQLEDFVNGGLRDGMFIHSVSSIVTLGCHDGACNQNGMEMMNDAAERASYFLQVLEVLGLPVKGLQQS